MCSANPKMAAFLDWVSIIVFKICCVYILLHLAGYLMEHCSTSEEKIRCKR